jgi:hypothetical protein
MYLKDKLLETFPRLSAPSFSAEKKHHLWRWFFNSNWVQLLQTKFIWQIPNAGETMSFLPQPFSWEWSVQKPPTKKCSVFGRWCVQMALFYPLVNIQKAIENGP